MLILTAVPDFIDLARAELRQAEPQARILSELGPGVLLVAVNGRFFILAQQWQTRPPIFVRHICPVLEQVSLAGQRADLAAIQQIVTREFLALFEPTLPFSVQTRILASVPYKPFDVNSALSDIIQTRTGAPLDVRQPVQILSVVIAAEAAYLGLSLAAHNLSDWAGGERRFARQKEQISRDEFKLLEALDVFQVNLPPRSVALDLGAAPGGWTRVLRQKDVYVTAVDPTPLHPHLQSDKNVRHLPITPETYLAQYPDTFDLIVSDSRLDARDAARLIVSYAPHLYPHGQAILTLKLPKEKREAALDHGFNILKTAYKIQNARQLFHNRSEITVCLTKLANIG